jgi:hypothetical protein
MLSGMGVPDLRGSQGTGTFYITAEDATAGEGKQVVVIRADARSRFVTRLVGPRITPGAGGLELDLAIDLDLAGDRVVLRFSGMTRSAVEVRGVRRREELYHGPYVDAAPGLLVLFVRGYRVSWSTPLGGIGTEVFSDNVKSWTGDHIVDPDLVPGVLFMDRPFRSARAHLVDLAPTILAALGVDGCPAMEGSSLLS